MPKNIVVYIDGTGNSDFDESKITNVVKLSRIAPDIPDHQIVLYLPGVGTENRRTSEPPSKRSFSRISQFLKGSNIAKYSDKILGATLGKGSTQLIKKAYFFISRNYVPGDSVYIFGFSRGAFISGALAGFIDKVGLLLKEVSRNRDTKALVDEAFIIYWAGGKLSWFLRKVTGKAAPNGDNRIPLHFLGQWDAVSALNLPGFGARSELRLRQIMVRERDRLLPDVLTHVRHALALHELRPSFEPILWKGCSATQSLKQRWFPGAHADIGGGYEDSRLSDFSLEWIANEARAKGLRFMGSIERCHSLRALEPHHEIRGLFAFSTPTIRKHLLQRKLSPLSGESIDEIAISRILDVNWGAYCNDYPLRVLVKMKNIDEITLRRALTLIYIKNFNNQGNVSSWLPVVLENSEFLNSSHRLQSFLQGSYEMTEGEIRNSLEIAIFLGSADRSGEMSAYKLALKFVNIVIDAGNEPFVIFFEIYQRLLRIYEVADFLSKDPITNGVEVLKLCLLLNFPRLSRA